MSGFEHYLLVLLLAPILALACLFNARQTQRQNDSQGSCGFCNCARAGNDPAAECEKNREIP